MHPRKKSGKIKTFRDPMISLWQSAVAATEARRRTRSRKLAALDIPVAMNRASSLQQATASAVEALRNFDADRPLTLQAPFSGTLALTAPPETFAAPSASARVKFCASAYLALAIAKVRQDTAAITEAEAALTRFGSCDGGWAEALKEFLLHYTLAQHGDVPYRRWTALGDFVLRDALPDRAKIAVLGDWGTGEERAEAMLRAIAALKPDIVIHLGDIYYSCDAREADAFYTNLRAVFPDAGTRIFSLCGNHDLYSGGMPYYALLDRLGQPASFFCLRNVNWQFLAMDTGYNDYDPFHEQTEITWVQDGTDSDGKPDGSYTELAWHADKLSQAGGRKTVLLSHHPLFTRNEAIDGSKVYNKRMLAQMQPWLGDITLWLWGHEHNQVIYATFGDLARGRCIGAGAIPVPAVEDLYGPSADFARGEAVPDLLDDPASRLGQDSATGLYNLGFAMLDLAGVTGSATYYCFNEMAGARVVFKEDL